MYVVFLYFHNFGAHEVSGIHCRNYITVTITVNNCACIFVAAEKQPTPFAEFHTRS